MLSPVPLRTVVRGTICSGKPFVTGFSYISIIQDKVVLTVALH